MVQGLRSAFENIIEETVGSSGSFAANTTKLETGAMTYQARFYSGSWRGDLLAYQVDVDSKQLVLPAHWSAASLLDARPWAANATTDKTTIIANSQAPQNVFTSDPPSAHP